MSGKEGQNSPDRSPSGDIYPLIDGHFDLLGQREREQQELGFLVEELSQRPLARTTCNLIRTRDGCSFHKRFTNRNPTAIGMTEPPSFLRQL